MKAQKIYNINWKILEKKILILVVNYVALEIKILKSF